MCKLINTSFPAHLHASSYVPHVLSLLNPPFASKALPFSFHCLSDTTGGTVTIVFRAKHTLYVQVHNYAHISGKVTYKFLDSIKFRKAHSSVEV